MKSTQQDYVAHCQLCGRELIGNGTKIYIAAHILRRALPNFQGAKMLGEESGAYVCKSIKKCYEPELQRVLGR